MIDNYVTGASGFIGRHLMRKLRGNTLRIEHGRMGLMDASNMFFLSTYGNMASHSNHAEMVKANVSDVIFWLGAGVIKKWFCYMSSSSVTLPVQTPYSRTKRAAEEILQALPELKSCIVRPYSVTGVGEQKEHLIPTLIRSCMEGEEMPFDPHPVHDFIDVDDVVDGLIYCADNQITGIVELGSGCGITNKGVRELVEYSCGRKANIGSIHRRHNRMRSYDTESWYCRKMPEWWKPKKPLSKSISEMVEAYKREH